MLSADIQTDRLILAILSEDEVDEDYRGWMSDPEVVRLVRELSASIDRAVSKHAVEAV